VAVLGDGVRPSSNGRGYVLRRLVRRSLTALRGVEGRLSDVPDPVLTDVLEHFHLSTPREEVRSVLLDEERRFERVLERGRKLVSNELRRGPLGPERLEWLRDTHGIPLEVNKDLVGEFTV
jgi:alanyl-tRNA synthetase